MYRIAQCAPSQTLDVVNEMRWKSPRLDAIVSPGYRTEIRVGPKRKRKSVIRFVLPGFVFVREEFAPGLLERCWHPDAAKARWMMHDGMSGVYAHCNVEELRPIADLAQRMANGTAELEQSLQGPAVGDWARVTEGPFAGLEGKVTFVDLQRARCKIDCEKIPGSLQIHPCLLETKPL